MVRFGAALSALLGLAACGQGEPPAGEPAAASSPAGEWTALFAGERLGAFERVGDANWTLENGWIGADSGSGFLVTRGAYGDFDLEVEFWVDAPANSGVFVRCRSPSDINARDCYEINIFDTRPDPTYRSGAIVDVAASSSRVHTAGRWNTYEITADGPRLTVRLNGVETVNVEDDRLESGVIALQHGAGRVLFRSVRIRPY